MSDRLDNYDPKKYIIIKGASMHNLKDIDLVLPRNKFIVLTGLSGSGKSSLAFDTLYAEGQRRYVESLSSYARQFLGRLDKPKVEYIKGLSPAIAIEQKVNTSNPRSTVGTSSEIYDYLKLLYARIGRTFSLLSGLEVKKETVSDVIDYIRSLEQGTRLLIAAHVKIPEGRSFTDALKVLSQQGYSRIRLQGKIVSIEDVLSFAVDYKQEIVELIVDRMAVAYDQDTLSRAADSVQTAFYEGKGTCFVEFADGGPSREFSSRFEADGMEFTEPSEHFFSFNNPVGACPVCEGYGKILGIDPELVVPNTSLSIYQGAIAPWRGEKMGQWLQKLILVADKFDFPIHKPYFELTDEQKKLLWSGNRHFKGLDAFFDMLEKDNYKMHYRIMLAKYRGKTTCPECGGLRLRKEASYVKVSGRSITELIELPLDELADFFAHLDINPHDGKVAERILIEVNRRLRFMLDVGLGYLTLNRTSSTLSGGESQRINLATSLGSSLVGSMYILDEPSIGLHQRDTDRLILILKALRDLGNTVIVVEHDEDIMRASDFIVDVGPMAGENGGEIVFAGVEKDLEKSDSITAKYLTGREQIPVPQRRRKVRDSILVKGARENNLKNIDVNFPLGMLTVVTGVSGSGKSTLVGQILYPGLIKVLKDTPMRVGEHDQIVFDRNLVGNIEMVDQNPIGKSSRSNPVTYVKAYDDIRDLFSKQKLSKLRGYTAKYFSFNVEGGRCEVCQGEGEITVEMQFMADVHLLCEACHGKRFKKEILEVEYEGKNIADVLEMTVDTAIDFFKEHGQTKIVDKIQPLQDVGLGYIHLGQPSSTLSGGEAQRIKLASFLTKTNVQEKTLFIFDEPTTGLHFYDIRKLLVSLNALIERGHSVVVVEHNPDVIKCADWVIDLGPDGGKKGGNLVFEGTPEDLVKCKESYTAPYIKEKLHKTSRGDAPNGTSTGI